MSESMYHTLYVYNTYIGFRKNHITGNGHRLTPSIISFENI